jgi:hypothetical protein
VLLSWAGLAKSASTAESRRGDETSWSLFAVNDVRRVGDNRSLPSLSLSSFTRLLLGSVEAILHGEKKPR